MATRQEQELLNNAYPNLRAFRAAYMAIRTPLPQGIYDRWENRVLPNHWQHDERGARAYLRSYGRNIGVIKLTQLARCAEEQGWPEFAMVMWRKAYRMVHPHGPNPAWEGLQEDAVTGTRVIPEPPRQAQPVDFYNELVEDQKFT